MAGDILTLSAPAKINLSLRILGRREDGYHTVETRMCPISLADTVSIQRIDGPNSTLICSDETVPADESNLAMKALRLFEEKAGAQGAWAIHLEKRIPHGAGLGGGSSDAAAVLRGLNTLCGQPLTLVQLAEVAAVLGSDVPFFLHSRVCDATGRGEQVTPIDFPWKLDLVLIKPQFGVSTPWAYKNWAESKELAGVRYGPQSFVWGEMRNDLERPVFQKYLLLPTLKNWLFEQIETLAAMMSGSGSTMYAVAKSARDADSLADKARELCGQSAQVFVASSL